MFSYNFPEWYEKKLRYINESNQWSGLKKKNDVPNVHKKPLWKYLNSHRKRPSREKTSAIQEAWHPDSQPPIPHGPAFKIQNVDRTKYSDFLGKITCRMLSIQDLFSTLKNLKNGSTVSYVFPCILIAVPIFQPCYVDIDEGKSTTEVVSELNSGKASLNSDAKRRFTVGTK